MCLLQLKRKCTKRNLASNIYNSNIPPCLCDGRRFLPGHDIWWGLFSTGQRETGGCPDSNFQSFQICTALPTRDGIPLEFGFTICTLNLNRGYMMSMAMLLQSQPFVLLGSIPAQKCTPPWLDQMIFLTTIKKPPCAFFTFLLLGSTE